MSSQIDTLVKMINQIADNAPRQETPEATAEAVAGHVRKFWAKPMKVEVKEYVRAGGVGLNEVAVEAVRRL
ncbi:MAG: formate dehydrogenase subunit delta [Saccharospirillum sp.]|uniref:formate dehydrogenase subunit delta n=1 Tax=Saccharospirillum sp. TaxID=2033801 RepID=UPI00329779D6